MNIGVCVRLRVKSLIDSEAGEPRMPLGTALKTGYYSDEIRSRVRDAVSRAKRGNVVFLATVTTLSKRI